MTDWPKPTWEPLALRCGSCKGEWDDWQPSNCRPIVWIAHIRSLRCPNCGAKRKLFIRFAPEPKPHDETPTRT